MRILQVRASRANGGAETYSADMMASLHAAGVEQVAVVPRASIQHDRLAAEGVGTVVNLAVCTFGDETRFFSYRRTTHRAERDYGRQISAIALT